MRLDILRHSTAHLLAQAVKSLYKDVKLECLVQSLKMASTTILISKKQLHLKTYKKIEKEMKKIVNENLEIVRHEVPRAEALRRFKEIGDEYKIRFN